MHMLTYLYIRYIYIAYKLMRSVVERRDTPNIFIYPLYIHTHICARVYKHSHTDTHARNSAS